MNTVPNHTFAICAYGQSPFLKACIESTLDQTLPGSEVYIATSTPSEWIRGIADEYGLPLHINTGDTGIGQDWNFAFSQSTREYVTIAHQDDIYCPAYAQTALGMLEAARKPIIFFCNYGELRNDVHVDDNKLLAVKRRLLAPLKDGRFSGSVFVRRRILSFGSAICCPSVTLSKSNCPNPPFRIDMKSNLDWGTWESYTRLDGDFLYSTAIGMYHRIHEDSTTSELIENNVRGGEDLEMFERFWPKPIAKLINSQYSKSEKSNAVEDTEA